ncbi:ATP-dependent zinc protease [Thiomicrorhabdus sp.]|uniref:ATP-dependent zinc protease family protein n=1 Tax=Thiomicrorhabdus sp. TaxID=2039724 RepID=UPI003568A23E
MTIPNIKSNLLIWLICLIILPIHSALAQTNDTPPVADILGWVEPVYVMPLKQKIEAKIDSGADHSSLHATDIELIDRQQKTWVRFRSLNRQTVTLPLLRYASIKRKDSTLEKRPVVQLTICLNRRILNVETNLVDRGHFKYPMLIGRSALANGVLIDPNRTGLTQPQCAIKTPSTQVN